MHNYDSLIEVAGRFGLTPAELDALSWGWLVGGPSLQDEKELLTHCVVRGEPDEEFFSLFHERLEANRTGLEQDEISLLLPDDDAPLEKRLQELSLWSRAFLTSLGFSKYLQQEDTLEKVRPLLEDCRAVGDLDSQSYGDYQTLEEAEIGYMEVYEFLRVNILLLFAELAARSIDNREN